MTVIISVKINDGIVMASDSASTFGNGQVYLHTDKIVNLVKGLPIGVMVTGAGGIGSESISTLLKDLRKRLDGSIDHLWSLDRDSYTIEQVAERVREFLFEEKLIAQQADIWMKLRICGYSAGRPLPEIWEVNLQGREAARPKLVSGEETIGPRWDGEYDPLNRLLLGVDSKIEEALEACGVPELYWKEIFPRIVPHTLEPFVLAAMPIQDAIDLAHWLVEVTAGYVRFSINKQPKTVGGPIELAAITKHEGFRWIKRRHFYPSKLELG